MHVGENESTCGMAWHGVAFERTDTQMINKQPTAKRPLPCGTLPTMADTWSPTNSIRPSSSRPFIKTKRPAKKIKVESSAFSSTSSTSRMPDTTRCTMAPMMAIQASESSTCSSIHECKKNMMTTPVSTVSELMNSGRSWIWYYEREP